MTKVLVNITEVYCVVSGDDVQLSSTVTYAMLPDCECGCLLNQSSGYIVVSSLVYCPSERIWLIRASYGLLIRLTFIHFNVQYGIVRVHDGNSSLSNLLLQIGTESTVLPQPLTSTRNKMRVEYVLPPAEPFDTDTTDSGFVALFLAIGMHTYCASQLNQLHMNEANRHL